MAESLNTKEPHDLTVPSEHPSGTAASADDPSGKATAADDPSGRGTTADYSSLQRAVGERFSLEDRDLRTYSPLTLAYIGDAVYELIVRTVLVKRGNCPVNALHRQASAVVKAGSQSAMMQTIEPLLTEEEMAVYRRGRNAHSPTMARHATMGDYRRATGFEALVGYLYMKEDTERLLDLVQTGLSAFWETMERKEHE